MNFYVLEQRLAVCRLAHDAPIPEEILSTSFLTITRTEDELSIVLPEDHANPLWQTENEWRGLKIEGPLDFEMVGVIAEISAPLASEGIPIFVISTFETDYLLVKEVYFKLACKILRQEGHTFDA